MMTAPHLRPRQGKDLDAGVLQPEISSFGLCLAAEGKSATGIRLSELARIRYSPGDHQRTDVDLERREITVAGKGGRTRVVKISYDAARAIDRYLRVQARHAPVPAPFQPYLAGPRRGGGRPDGLNGWSSAQMLRRYGASARSARARRTYDRIMTDRP
jgi:integrase/recombinase XerD